MNIQKVLIATVKVVLNIVMAYIYISWIDGLREMMRGLYGTSTLDFFYLSSLFLYFMIPVSHLVTTSFSSVGFILLSADRWNTQFYKADSRYWTICLCLILPGIIMDYVLSVNVMDLVMKLPL